MNHPLSSRNHPASVRSLLAHERNLLEEIHLYVREHQDLNRHSRQGLKQLESILLDDIEDLEQGGLSSAS